MMEMRLADYIMPSAEAVKASSSMLFGDATVVTECDEPADVVYIARYVNPGAISVAQVIADLPFSAYSASALSMMNLEAANQFIEAGLLSDEAKGNLYEVMNIYSTLFMDDNTAHLKLISVEHGTFWADASVAQQKHFEVDIPDFGKGHLTFTVRYG